MNSFYTKSTLANCIRLLAIFLVSNLKFIDFLSILLLIILLIIKNNYTKDLYSSGIIFNYSEMNQTINIINIIFTIYFMYKCIESSFS
jgi:hypothetical protein